LLENVATSWEEAGKWSGESEIVYNVYKFMKTENPLSKVQNRVPEATCVSRRPSCSLLKEAENVETGVTRVFSSPPN